MRVLNVTVQDDKIIKRYELSSMQRNGLQRHLDEYMSWIRTLGFITPETTLSTDDSSLTFHQAYIQGIPPTIEHWIRVIDCILDQPEKMTYGLDANPLNFIFNDEGVCFIDFYPLLVNTDRAFLASQFNYDQPLILTRYFTKWNVLVCFLNRLKKIDEPAFIACLVYLSGDIIKHLPNISGRDALRLLEAIRQENEAFSDYYNFSRQHEHTLTKDEIKTLTEALQPYADSM